MGEKGGVDGKEFGEGVDGRSKRAQEKGRGEEWKG